jgi:hypothetical protein
MGGVRITALQVGGNILVLQAAVGKILVVHQMTRQFLTMGAIQHALTANVHRTFCVYAQS